MRQLGPTVLFALLASGCFAVADLDRFEQQDPETLQRTFEVDLMGFDDFVGQRVEVRVVDELLAVEARAVIEDMPANHDFVMVGGVLPGPKSVDIYVDENADGQYTDGEPSWRRPLDSDGKLDFVADDAQTPINDPDTRPIGGDFVLDFVDMGPHTPGTQSLELVVVEKRSGQTVGYHFLPDVTENDFSVRIPGVVVNGLQYRVDFFADVDQDGEYDPLPVPPGDHAWRLDLSGGTTGIQAEFTHNTMFVDVSESFPDPDDV